jgi:hypothetical protein
MKQIILISTLILSFNFFGQVEKSKPVYIDQYDHEVSKEYFEKMKTNPGLMAVHNDSLNVFKLITQYQRKSTGKIDDSQYLIDELVLKLNIAADSTKPILLIYYPGKDRCNSTGSATHATRKQWYYELEKGTKKIAGIKPIYVYKNSEGLEKYDGIMEWQKDPNSIIENYFFKYHYPCSSYVIITPERNFIAIYGEFGKESVFKNLKEISKIDKEKTHN